MANGENTIYIHVTDSDNICAPEYKEAFPEWNGDVYTVEIDKKDLLEDVAEWHRQKSGQATQDSEATAGSTDSN